MKLSQYLEATPGVCGGKPRLAGTRISVKDIVLMHLKMGQSLAQIAGTYDLAMSAVHEALADYYDHQQEVDRMIEEDQAYVASPGKGIKGVRTLCFRFRPSSPAVCLLGGELMKDRYDLPLPRPIVICPAD